MVGYVTLNGHWCDRYGAADLILSDRRPSPDMESEFRLLAGWSLEAAWRVTHQEDRRGYGYGRQGEEKTGLRRLVS